jgi:hypothetical protein
VTSKHQLGLLQFSFRRFRSAEERRRVRKYPANKGGETLVEKQIPYGLKITFLVHFIAGIIFGLGQLLIPEIMMGMIGFSIQEPTISIFRMVGAAVLGFTTSSWFAYKETLWDRVKIVWTTLATLTMLWALIFVGLPTALWMNVVIMGAFAVAFTTFYYRT